MYKAKLLNERPIGNPAQFKKAQELLNNASIYGRPEQKIMPEKSMYV